MIIKFEKTCESIQQQAEILIKQIQQMEKMWRELKSADVFSTNGVDRKVGEAFGYSGRTIQRIRLGDWLHFAGVQIFQMLEAEKVDKDENFLA